jgi:hypothetical protein
MKKKISYHWMRDEMEPDLGRRPPVRSSHCPPKYILAQLIIHSEFDHLNPNVFYLLPGPNVKN